VEFGFGEKFHEDTMRVIKETKGKDFAVMSGEDGLFADLLEMGGTGLISASGNIPEATKTFVELYKAFQAGDKDKAHNLQKAPGLYDITFCRKNPDSARHAVQQPAVPAAREREGYGQRRRRSRPHHEADRREGSEPEEVSCLVDSKK
jgi:Dihydrodipicolinate synthase/N-acetylneuraminate lyase